MPENVRNPLGSEKLTVAAAAVGFASIPKGATFAKVAVETAQIRWRQGPTAPSATDGIPANAGDILDLEGNLTLFQAIRTGGTSATLQIEYYA